MPSRKTAQPSLSRPQTPAEGTSTAIEGAGKPPSTATASQPVEGDEFRNVTAEVQQRQDAEDDDVPTPPSSLNMDRPASAARSGHEQMTQRRRQQNAVDPDITGGDEDADAMGGYFVGDEAPSGDNPTPGQVDVEQVGQAVGETYQDNEELKFTDKITKRDRHRWELDPASSEDYAERVKKGDDEI